MDDFLIKRLDAEMLDGVAELERLCFHSPWSSKALSLLCGESAVGFVAVGKNGDVLAYGGMLCVLDEGQITNIATHPGARRNGMGAAVVNALIEYGLSAGLVTISLEVRESNAAAIALYEKFGFENVGMRKNFYTSPVENAIIMIKNL